jgi:hypothetical protein
MHARTKVSPRTLLVVLRVIFNNIIDLSIAELLRLAYSSRALLLRRVVRQDPINYRITKLIALLELKFWHLSKLV